MVLTVKHRVGIYRRFGVDIWGLSFFSLSDNNKAASFFSNLYSERKLYRRALFRRYNFRIDVFATEDHKSFARWNFISLRILKLFYLTLSYKQLGSFSSKAAKKDGLFQNNYCLYLEGRLLPLVYRSNFLYNMFEIRAFIKNANLFINGIAVNYVNFLANVGDIVTFNKYSLIFLKRALYKRLRARRVLFTPPRYLYVNFKLFFTFIETLPFAIDFAFPSKVDILRAVSFN